MTTGDVLEQTTSISCTKATELTRALQDWKLMFLEVYFEYGGAATSEIASGLSAEYFLRITVLAVKVHFEVTFLRAGIGTVCSLTLKAFNLPVLSLMLDYIPFYFCTEVTN